MSGEPTKRMLPRTGYPRRRAVTACEVCRERKKRCDNARPSCSFCQSIGVHCEYRGRDEASFDPSSLAILDRLAVLETLMRQHNCATPVPPIPVFAHQSPAGETPGSEALQSETSQAPNSWMRQGSGGFTRVDTILQWPIFERPLANIRKYPFLNLRHEQDYTYLQDMFHAPFPQSSSTNVGISIERTEMQRLVDRFFLFVHTKNPILDRQVVKQYCLEYCENGPGPDLRSCLVLLVCALASAAQTYYPVRPLQQNHGQSRSRSVAGEDLEMAHCYFAAAEQRLGAAMTQQSSLAAQCLCLAGIYHMFLVHPIAAHAMFHHAGYIMQLLASTGQDTLDESSQVGSSLYWACFKSEREILAELPIALPALSRPSQAHSYPIPPQERFMSSSDSVNDIWARAEEDSWYFFLSEIAFRRIVDEVSELVGNLLSSISAFPLSSPNVQRLLDEWVPISLELERQIFSWREHLPPSIRFPDSPIPVSTEWQQFSRSPFYRTLELINRPFIYAFAHGLDPGPVIRDLANKGLRFAQGYLRTSPPTHAHHGRPIQMRHELRMSAILFSASRSGLEMPHGWYEDVRSSTRSFLYWETTAPQLRSYIDVVLALDDHFRGGNSECTGSLREEQQGMDM